MSIYTPPYDVIKGLVDMNEGNMTLHELVGKATELNVDAMHFELIVQLSKYDNMENAKLGDIIYHYEQEQKLFLLVGFFLLGLRILITLLGVLGNVLSLITWSRPELKSSSSVVFVSLAVCDTLIILSALWFGLPASYVAHLQYNGGSISPGLFSFVFDYYNQLTTILCRVIFEITSIASKYLTVLITVQRYICICHPFQFSDWCSRARTYKLVTLTMIFSFVYHMSRFWEYRLVERTGSLGGQIITYYNSENTELVRNEHYVKLKRYWLFIILDFLLPLASIIVLNAVTFFKLKKMNSKRRVMTDSSESDDKLTKMMLYVILEFFVLTSLTGFVNIASMFPTDFSRYVYTMPGSGYFATQVKLILDSLNSSVNLVTYFTSWPPFRKAFLKIFCCQEAQNQFSPPSPRNPVKASNTKTTPF